MQYEFTDADRARFWAQVDASGDCWEWTGHRYTLNRYGRFRAGGKVAREFYAHRIAWEWLVGPIAPKAVMDHLCRVRWCVNPDHLEPVTDRVNVVERGYGVASEKAKAAWLPRLGRHSRKAMAA